jgi:cytochrome c oxidase assembly protein subunit 15
MCALVALMVIVGGATRLTDSGLSIVEWRPVTGAIPPLSEADWLAEFAKYKTIPEYQQVNWGMTLGAFKRIYWWEWSHRFLGRFIGFAFLVPLIAFAATKRIDRALGVKLAGLFVLGGMQGALGWWMVSSGLTERIDVSQYRLAAHLSLAVALYAAMLWIALDLVSVRRERPLALAPFAFMLAGGVYLQMILGAFVAGLRAGRTFNTWPLMDGKFFPDGYFSGAPGLNDLFETAAAAQFNHRMGAYLLAAAAIWFLVAARKTQLKRRAHVVIAAVFMQIALGVWTVLAATPVALGLAHQAGALIVLSSALFAAHGCLMSIERTSSTLPAG